MAKEKECLRFGIDYYRLLSEILFGPLQVTVIKCLTKFVCKWFY